KPARDLRVREEDPLGLPLAQTRGKRRSRSRRSEREDKCDEDHRNRARTHGETLELASPKLLVGGFGETGSMPPGERWIAAMRRPRSPEYPSSIEAHCVLPGGDQRQPRDEGGSAKPSYCPRPTRSSCSPGVV